MTFSRVYSILPEKMFTTAQLTQNWKSYQLSKPEIEFHVMEKMYAALCMCRKDDIFRQRQLNYSGVGEELHLDGSIWPELTQPDGRLLMMETTFDGRRPSMEDNLGWKTTLNGRRPMN